MGKSIGAKVMADLFHNFWRMDTRDFSHERKCAITPFLRTYIRVSASFVL